MDVCRICLTILKDQCLDITTTYIEDKSLAQLMEAVGQVTIQCAENLPRHVCGTCSEKLYKFHEMRKQIISTETNLCDKVLTIVQAGDKSLVVFVEKQTEETQPIIGIVGAAEIDLEDHPEDKPELITNGDLDEVLTSEVKVEDCVLVDEVNIKEEGDVVEVESDLESEEKSASPTIKNEPFSCEPCHKSFRLLSLLIAHKKRVHIGQSICNVCAECFASEDDLANHLDVHQENPYICQSCGRRFRYPQQLKSHQVSHVQSKSICNVCGKEVHKNSINRHKKLHEESNIKRNICQQEEVKTLSNLNEHKRSKRLDKYECELCGTFLSTYASYQRHKKIHIGVKHKCSICEAIYSERSKCKRHVKRFHPDQDEDSDVIVSLIDGV